MGIDTKIWLFRGVSQFAILLKKLYNFVFSSAPLTRFA